MRRINLIVILCLTPLFACGTEEETMECLTVDEAEICLPASYAMAHAEADRMLFYEDGGWIEVYSVVDHPFVALADIAEAAPHHDARTREYRFVDDHPTYYYHLLRQDDGISSYYEFAGIATIALAYDCGVIYGVRHVVFRGFWPEETAADALGLRINQFVHAIEIDDGYQ